MDRRRILRSPWLYVVAAVVLFFLVFQPLFSGSGGFSEVPTSTALAQVDSGNYSKVVINDKEQTLDITLNNEVEGHKKIRASYPADAAERVFTMLEGKDNKQFDTNVS